MRRMGQMVDSDVVRELGEIGTISLYHDFLREEQGKELYPTFYHQRNLIKPYHIDNCFAPETFLSRLEGLKLGGYEEWISISDHVPMFLTFNDQLC